MSLSLVESFFPATSNLLKINVPFLWEGGFVPLLNATPNVPHILFKVHSGSHSFLVKWPALVPVCIGGIILGAFGSFKFFSKALSVSNPPPRAFSWAYAYLWYSLMCVSGLLHHCIYPLHIFRMIDIVSTCNSSLSIIGALLSHVSWWKDTESIGRHCLHGLFFVVGLIARFGHPLLQEQLYLFPIAVCGLLMVFLLNDSMSLKPKNTLFMSVEKSAFLSGQKWLALSIVFVFAGFSMVLMDQFMFSNFGPHFLVIFWVFLGSDFAFLFMYFFACTLCKSGSTMSPLKQE